MHAHMGGPWDILTSDSEPSRARWLAKWNLEDMPRRSDSNYHEGVTHSLSPRVCVCVCVCIHMYSFFLLINTLLVSLLSLCKNLILQSWWARILSLATVPGGLVARIHLSHCFCLTSGFGQGAEIQLVTTAGQGHLKSNVSINNNSNMYIAHIMY